MTDKWTKKIIYIVIYIYSYITIIWYVELYIYAFDIWKIIQPLKKKEILLFAATTGMKLEGIVLSEISQIGKDKY